jgi:hypothetical protein
MTTKEQDDAIRRMYPDQTVSIADIEAVTKLAASHIRVRAFRLGVKRGPQAIRKPSRKPKEQDIATRLSVLLGQEPRPVAPNRRLDIPVPTSQPWACSSARWTNYTPELSEPPLLPLMKRIHPAKLKAA